MEDAWADDVEPSDNQIYEEHPPGKHKLGASPPAMPRGGRGFQMIDYSQSQCTQDSLTEGISYS